MGYMFGYSHFRRQKGFKQQFHTCQVNENIINNGNIICIMDRFKIDLHPYHIQGDCAELHLRVNMGVVDLEIPPKWSYDKKIRFLRLISW